MHFGEAINSCWLRAFGIDVLINFVSKVTIFLQFSEKSLTSPKIEERLKIDPIPGGLHSRVVYNFTCAGCNACYVGETTRHFSTRVREHLAVDKASHIFKHLQMSRLMYNRLLSYLRSRHYQLSTQDKRGYPYSKRTTLPQSTITPC